MSNKFTKMLKSLEGSVDFNYDAFSSENCIYTPSPSVNWIFANKSMGIPKGTATLFFSEPKAGKSLLIQGIVGELHQRDPEAIAIVFNSEMRGFIQSGLFETIDKDRMIVYDTNRPEDIFDRTERDILPLIQDGAPIRMIAIDSLTNIGGTKSMSPDRSVNDHLVGDHALTIQRGLQKLMPIIRNHKINLFATAQIRSNVDAGNPYAPKEKMAASWAVKHAFEYFISVRRANAADDRVDIEGKKFEDDSMKDLRGNKGVTGHKIVIKMDQSSIGTAGRAGMITLDYDKGIVNTNEEVFLLGYGTGVIKREGVSNYVFEDIKINGKANFAKKIKEDGELASKILEEIKKLDQKGI
jgi:RecA/RadA recombinase